MATEYKAVLNFADAEGSNITFSYKLAKASPTATAIKNAMSEIIACGGIFKRVPVRKKSAYIVATDQTSYEVE